MKIAPAFDRQKSSDQNNPKSITYQIRFLLLVYDVLLQLAVTFLILVFIPNKPVQTSVFFTVFGISVVFSLLLRMLFSVYRQIWRYASVESYLRFVLADGISMLLSLVTIRAGFALNLSAYPIIVCSCLTLLVCLSIRFFYRYLYLLAIRNGQFSAVCSALIFVFSGFRTRPNPDVAAVPEKNKIKIAIVGAGRVGTGLAEELVENDRSPYEPVCFIDKDNKKAGRSVFNLPIYMQNEDVLQRVRNLGVQEIVFAFPDKDGTMRNDLYNFFRPTGCRIKTYDYPVVQTTLGTKRQMREFDIEDLLFRDPIVIQNEHRNNYYHGKTILITGGGGSIGSELCRQVAKMEPKKLIILDIYENGAYDVQQELRQVCPELDLSIEILSVTDRPAMEKVFDRYRPDIVINAAAHKHVPLMEHNCCEAIANNVFGTLNTVLCAEKYGVQRVMMVSTDKAVNPTNVMGATKRMCEIIVQCHSQMGTGTTFSATRFGNVLGSAGSVIPLFKRQIAAGGPVTLTDKRIIRYFMTIPEASQLVLESGAMAKNGELFCLDMGRPIKILELAENMIRLSGFEPYRDINIIETGLRPGEKLYEELLIKSEDLGKTENQMIFVEKDTPITPEDLEQRLDMLRKAIATGDDVIARETLKKVVPTYHSPDEVNAKAGDAAEMKIVQAAEQADAVPELKA